MQCQTSLKSNTQQREEIAQLVERYLESHQPRSYRMLVDRDSIVKRHGYWLVVVDPSKDNMPAHDIINRMVEAELDLTEATGIQVQLLPLIPPEDD